MTDQEQKAMQMALDALDSCEFDYDWEDRPYKTFDEDLRNDAVDALRKVLAQPEQEPHQCELNSPYQAYGNAIDDCHEDAEGRFWAGNGEYGSQVNYCPVCGTKAPKQVDGDSNE